MHGRATAVTPELSVTVRIDLLGPLRLHVDGEPSEVPGTRRRAVLALLALSEGRSVTVDELLSAVWPSEVPDSGRRALHSHVSRVRGHLGRAADRLVREGDSYRLVLLPGELDVVEVRQLAGRSEQVAAGEAVGLLRDALGQWRGTALDEFADVAPLAAAGVGLEELRRDLQDRLLEVRLASGPDAALVHDAARAAAADPLRERTQLVLARVARFRGTLGRGAAGRARPAAPAGRRDRARPLPGRGRARDRDRDRDAGAACHGGPTGESSPTTVAARRPSSASWPS